MDTLRHLRQTIRSLAARRGFTLTVILTLAVGFGANTTAFSVLYGVLLAPLPFYQPDRVLLLSEHSSGGIDNGLVSPITFEDWETRATWFEELAAYRFWENRTIDLDGGSAIPVLHVTTTPNYFSALGWKPALGRTYGLEKVGGVNEAILSHDVWIRIFHGDRDVLGKLIRINNAPFEVVGVMPPMHKEVGLGLGDVWSPLHRYDMTKYRPSSYRARYLRVLARPKAGVTVEEARDRLTILQQQLAAESMSVAKGYRVRVESMTEGTTGRLSLLLYTLFAASGLVLLIACANVANLMLVRNAARTKELAIRLALGASRWQLTRETMLEALVLSALGALSGLALAYWGLSLLKVSLGDRFPRLAVADLHWPVLLFTALVVILCALLFGILPLFAGKAQRVHEDLKESGRSGSGGVHRRRVRSVLVASEVAFAVLLLCGAGLLLKSFAALLRVDPGFATDGRTVADVVLPPKDYESIPRRTSFYREMFRRLREEPGVLAAGGALYFPCRPKLWLSTVWVEGAAVEEGLEPIVYYNLFVGDYFQAMGITLKSGRLPMEEEMWENRQVVLINEVMATQVFQNADPVGKRFKTEKNGPWKTIIGVVGNVRQEGLDRTAKSEYYVPFSDMPMPFNTLVTHTRNDATRAASMIHRIVQEGDARVNLAEITSLAEIAERTVAHRYLAFLLLGLFATIAVSLAGIGIYGVLSYVVAQSTSELGVRMALGANRREIVQLFTWKGLRAAAAGAAIGLLLALIAAKPIGALLYEVSPFDPWIYTAVPLITLITAAIACAVPALRASNTDPLTALRHE